MNEEYILVGNELLTLAEASKRITELEELNRKGTSERDFQRLVEKDSTIAKQEDLIIDLVNQGCSYKNGWNTMALSTYQEAVEYLVSVGKAKWVHKGFTFEFVGVE